MLQKKAFAKCANERQDENGKKLIEANLTSIRVTHTDEGRQLSKEGAFGRNPNQRRNHRSKLEVSSRCWSTHELIPTLVFINWTSNQLKMHWKQLLCRTDASPLEIYVRNRN
ncbi:unnamed protein product [Caenorhabditis angaria]|uniref:Uncharacterized protein n=1 Tax=Caenorhabditis angaria TaxID=860376 RepID=A0A9P1ILZ3_9PELO|nr:unnamed protein product [Caenorhabditis angaria]